MTNAEIGEKAINEMYNFIIAGISAGTAKNDLIFGERGDDTLVGNGGNDVLYGGAGSDTLIGGSGNDTYITDNGDKVYDQDGIGHVEFYGMTLSGGTQMEGVANTYEGNGGIYTLNPTNKVLTFTKNGTSIEIHDFDKANNELHYKQHFIDTA